MPPCPRPERNSGQMAQAGCAWRLTKLDGVLALDLQERVEAWFPNHSVQVGAQGGLSPASYVFRPNPGLIQTRLPGQSASLPVPRFN